MPLCHALAWCELSLARVNQRTLSRWQDFFLPTFAAQRERPDLVEEGQEGLQDQRRELTRALGTLGGQTCCPSSQVSKQSVPAEGFVFIGAMDGDLLERCWVRAGSWCSPEQRHHRGDGVWREPFSQLRWPKTSILGQTRSERGDEGKRPYRLRQVGSRTRTF